MSRTVASFLHALAAAATAPQSPKRRTATLSRLIEKLGADQTVEVSTARGPLKTLPYRGPHLAAAAVGFETEEPETLAWIGTFQPGEVFYDVGAASGLLSMYAALTPGVSVYAFEPKATSFGVLVEHLALNDLGARVFPLCLALSDATAATHLTLSSMAPGSGGNSVGGAPDQFGLTRSVFSQGALAYRLDDLIAAFALPPPTALKIDVDGQEGAVLRGAARALCGVRGLMIEVEGLNAAQAEERLEPALTAAGLVEDLTVRRSGSGRNRLFVRP